MTVFSSKIAKAVLAASSALALTFSLIQPAQAEDAPVPTLFSASDVATRPITEDSVGMQMFGWNWNSLATECPGHLGPNGINWILVMPPSDHINGTEWWIHYQPTSYQLNSDLGTATEFAAMVKACNDAGVQVVVDAVVNHMAGSSGVSYAGVKYGTNLNFFNADGTPLYTAANFHEGLAKTDPHYCDHNINNWDAEPERFDCRFPGLPDLATEQPYVQQQIAKYLNSMLDLGVAGFRIDAAKHMPPADIASIEALLHGKPYIVQEVPGGKSQNADYLATGDVWAWDTVNDANKFFSRPGSVYSAGIWDTLADFNFNPSSKSLTWVTNHDTEHHGGAVNYHQTGLYQLAFVWDLAVRFGKPMLYSAYTYSYSNSDGSAPRVDNKIADAKCASDTGPLFGSSKVKKTVIVKKKKVTKYVTVVNRATDSYKPGYFTCVQRWTAIAGMTAFHHSVGRAEVSNTYAKLGTLAFARTGKGYIVINSAVANYAAKKMATGLPAGVYCDLITGGGNPVKTPGSACVGTKVTVASDGTLTATVPGISAIAITVDSKL